MQCLEIWIPLFDYLPSYTVWTVLVYETKKKKMVGEGFFGRNKTTYSVAWSIPFGRNASALPGPVKTHSEANPLNGVIKLHI